MINTFFFVTFAWVFFRADNIGIAIDYFKKMAYDFYNYPGQILLFPEKLNCLIYIVPLIIFDWFFRRDERKLKMSKFPFINFIIVIIMAIFILNNFLGYLDGKPSSFIYFQF
jgi:D-alanyl-lipoteichoic acid acyltransferase DltB (MBOAT superfamily)